MKNFLQRFLTAKSEKVQVKVNQMLYEGSDVVKSRVRQAQAKNKGYEQFDDVILPQDFNTIYPGGGYDTEERKRRNNNSTDDDDDESDQDEQQQQKQQQMMQEQQNRINAYNQLKSSSSPSNKSFASMLKTNRWLSLSSHSSTSSTYSSSSASSTGY